MDGYVTQRDRVWAAIIQVGTIRRRFRTAHVHQAVDGEDPPSHETVRRALVSGKRLGVIEHSPGSPWYRLRR